MTKPLLSICIPTYDRPERIEHIIKQIISFPSEEIEIIIGDDNPLTNKTQDVVKTFNDSRINYFRNNKNLGLDGNLLKIINRANGEYIFILMDDDDIEIENLPWILKTTKENNKFSYIFGSLIHRTPNYSKPYYQLKDKVLRRGSEALTQLMFRHSHASGIVLKKKTLELNKLKKYIGFLYLQTALTSMAMIKGDTLCTSRIFARTGLIKYESQHSTLFKGRKYNSPIGRLVIAKYRIQIIYDLTNTLKNSKKEVRTRLLNKQRSYIYCNFHEIMITSFRDFLDGLYIIVTMKKISKSPKFWFQLIKEVIYHSFKSKFYKIYRPHGGRYYPSYLFH